MLSHPDEQAPNFKSPALACDAHFHVFGAPDRYPHGTGLRYPPPLAPLPEYLRLASRLGIERMVFVQPSAYGRDNRCMLDAMQEIGVARCRGIVDVDENIADTELDRLNTLGVRGVRINVSPVQVQESGLMAKLLPRIRRLDARCAEIGWHLDFLLPGWLTKDLMKTLHALECEFTLAHMGMFLAKDRMWQPGFQQLLDLLRNGNGGCWVKFTGTYRISTAPDFADVLPMAQSLIEAAPDRIIWGSDYPHLSFADKVGSVALFNLLEQWAPDPAIREAILTKNPARLFGFS
jgi:2-pyrone-4,6-dicarboxylate lactonase